MQLVSPESLSALAQVVTIDLVLAGDNAIVIGLAAASLPRAQRARAVLIGILAATVLRIGFALGAARLLHLTGLLFAGGLLLLWVAWKMAREILEPPGTEEVGARTLAVGEDFAAPPADLPAQPKKTLGQAVSQIVIADVSMSLDNILAVAGAAREHMAVLAVGLVLSIGLMGLAASLVARVLARHRWLSWLGLAVILYVALMLIWDGGQELLEVAAI